MIFPTSGGRGESLTLENLLLLYRLRILRLRDSASTETYLECSCSHNSVWQNWGYIHVFTSNREPTREQHLTPLKFTLVSRWVWLGLLTGIWVEGCSQEQKRLKDSRTTKAHTNMNDSWQKLRTWSTLYRLQAAYSLKSIFCKQLI